MIHHLQCLSSLHKQTCHGKTSDTIWHQMERNWSIKHHWNILKPPSAAVVSPRFSPGIQTDKSWCKWTARSTTSDVMYPFACLQCDMWNTKWYSKLQEYNMRIYVVRKCWKRCFLMVGSCRDLNNHSMRVSFWTQLIECLIIEDIRSCHTKKHCRSISASQRASHHSFQFGGETLQVCLAFRADLKLSIM